MQEKTPQNQQDKPEKDQEGEGRPLHKSPKALLPWIAFLLLFLLLIYTAGRGNGSRGSEITPIDLLADIENERVVTAPDKKLIVHETKIVWYRKVEGGEPKRFEIPVDEHTKSKIIDALFDKKTLPYDTKRSNQMWLYLAGSILPWLLIIGFLWFFLFRQMRAPGGGPGGILSFGKSRAKLTSKEHTGVNFGDVAGIKEAKEEVQEIIEFLRNPAKFQRLGGRIPRGVLLIGRPGTGKTLLARAIAGEADVPFFSISGSDFVEMFVGVGASRVRDLFRQAKECSPCIIFLDEIDAVGRRRGHGWGGGHDEREQTLNAILVEMDGFESDASVILIAATNRPDVLDPALMRPGRFDRAINVDLPDVKGREEILKVHARKVRMGDDVDFSILARGTPMFSGADLEAIINEAALLATLHEKEAVDMSDLEESRDKVLWGRQKRSRVMAEEDKCITAYHESGHALIAKLLPEVEPLHKVTIIPRGMYLGATMQLPERDRYHKQRKQVLGDITTCFGGRISEEMFCKDLSSGASSDIKQATELARMMVCEWGMSDVVGPISYAESEEKLYGGEVVLSKKYSEATAIQIDEEVRKIVDTCYKRAQKLLKEHSDDLERIAKALLIYEALDGEEVDTIMAGKLLDRKPAAAELEIAESTSEKSSAPSQPENEKPTEVQEKS